MDSCLPVTRGTVLCLPSYLSTNTIRLFLLSAVINDGHPMPAIVERGCRSQMRRLSSSSWSWKDRQESSRGHGGPTLRIDGLLSPSNSWNGSNISTTLKKLASHCPWRSSKNTSYFVSFWSHNLWLTSPHHFGNALQIVLQPETTSCAVIPCEPALDSNRLRRVKTFTSILSLPSFPPIPGRCFSTRVILASPRTSLRRRRIRSTIHCHLLHIQWQTQIYLRVVWRPGVQYSELFLRNSVNQEVPLVCIKLSMLSSTFKMRARLPSRE
ncbi:hypothetical protein HD554DRAFT_807667 [Boletus coccyginus]|nr:hypothetical protein HD554DRAFT_807667 [Boletus coccyginus]